MRAVAVALLVVVAGCGGTDNAPEAVGESSPSSATAPPFAATTAGSTTVPAAESPATDPPTTTVAPTTTEVPTTSIDPLAPAGEAFRAMKSENEAAFETIYGVYADDHMEILWDDWPVFCG
jgi:hypothetical protein